MKSSVVTKGLIQIYGQIQNKTFEFLIPDVYKRNQVSQKYFIWNNLNKTIYMSRTNNSLPGE